MGKQLVKRNQLCVGLSVRNGMISIFCCLVFDIGEPLGVWCYARELNKSVVATTRVAWQLFRVHNSSSSMGN